MDEARKQQANETRQRNANLRKHYEARRDAIEAQVSAILETVTKDPDVTTEQRVRLAELACDLYRAF